MRKPWAALTAGLIPVWLLAARQIHTSDMGAGLGAGVLVGLSILALRHS